MLKLIDEIITAGTKLIQSEVKKQKRIYKIESVREFRGKKYKVITIWKYCAGFNELKKIEIKEVV